MRNPATWQNAAALSRAARRLDPAGEGIVGAECREQSRSLADAEVFSLDIPFNRTADHPCKLTRAFSPRNSMKIGQSQAIIQNGVEWRDRKDNGDIEAACKFDPERA
jgi:hypothetical protein